MKSDTRSFYEQVVHRALVSLVDSLDDAVDLAALSRAAALSPLHFHRIFRGLVGETALEIHRRLRMERAAHQLASGDAPVTRIAFEAGYETHESFTRAFGERYAVPPLTFRQRAGDARASCARPPPTELAARSGVHFDPDHRAVTPRFFLEGEPVMQVDLKNIPELRVAAVRHVGPYNRISEAFARLGDIAHAAGLVPRPGAEMIALYHDDPEAVPVDELRSDAALTVPNDASLPPGVTELRIPAGRYACAVHVGPYTKLGDAWAQLLGAWLPRSGQRLADGPSFEIYRNDPSTASPAELRTEIYAPLRAA